MQASTKSKKTSPAPRAEKAAPRAAKAAKAPKAVKAAKATKAPTPAKAAKSTKQQSAATGEMVPLLVYVPRRARERLNKLVTDVGLANQAEAITKLINDAYKK